jgi:hypothetical protein
MLILIIEDQIKYVFLTQNTVGEFINNKKGVQETYSTEGEGRG